MEKKAHPYLSNILSESKQMRGEKTYLLIIAFENILEKRYFLTLTADC